MLCQRCYEREATWKLVGEILQLPVCDRCAKAAVDLEAEAKTFAITLYPLKGDRIGRNGANE